MAIFDTLTTRVANVVKVLTGNLDQKTQKVEWSDNLVDYTSSFMQAVNLFIAREFSKLSIQHRVYIQQPDGNYLTKDKLGSDIYETLNFSPNGMKNNTEWKREIAKRLATGSTVYLKPIRRKSGSGSLLSELLFVDSSEYAKNPDDILVVTSPISVSQNASLYDSILTNIGTQLNSKRLRGFLKINGVIDSKNQNFKDKAMEQLTLMQEVSDYNGLGVLDAKSDVVELQKDYSTIDPEVMKVIKSEILSGYGISEKLLSGEYTESDYQHFFDNVLAPIISEFEKELTYKLLTNNARINNGEKQSFERIVISIDVFKFASVSDLIKLAVANTNGAYMTVNEVRQMFGRDPIEGGDVFRTNLNSTEVEYNESGDNS